MDSWKNRSGFKKQIVDVKKWEDIENWTKKNIKCGSDDMMNMVFPNLRNQCQTVLSNLTSIKTLLNNREQERCEKFIILIEQWINLGDCIEIIYDNLQKCFGGVEYIEENNNLKDFLTGFQKRTSSLSRFLSKKK